MGIIYLITAIVASPRIETQPTEIGNIAALAGVSSLALIGFGGIVSGIILIWALKKSGQIESMEKSLRKIANGITVIESFQKERLDELEKQKEVQKTVDYEKDPEKSSIQQIIKPDFVHPGRFFVAVMNKKQPPTLPFCRV